MNKRWLYQEQAGGAGDGGSGGAGDVVQPEAARAFLTEFGHNADTLKTLPDADVLTLHKTVNTNYSNRVKTESTKAAETAAAAAKEAAKNLKLELPKEGATLVQEDVDDIAAYARAKGLTPEQATELMQRENAAQARFSARNAKQVKEVTDGWVAQVKTDPEIGGEKLAATQANTQKVIDKFMVGERGTRVREFLRESGFGSHPDVAWLMSKIGAAMADDGGMGGGGGGGGGGNVPLKDTLYPTTVGLGSP